MHLLAVREMHFILFAFPYPALYLLIREIQPVVQNSCTASLWSVFAGL